MSASAAVVLIPPDWTKATARQTGAPSIDNIALGGGDFGVYREEAMTGAVQPGDYGQAYDTCFFGGTTTTVTSTLAPTVEPPFPPVWPFPTGLIYSRENFSMNLRMVRGDTYKFDANIVIDGDAVDISGAAFRFTVKWDYWDADANALMIKTSPSGGITILSDVNGQIRVTIDPADTLSLPAHQVDFYYDVQMKNAANEVYTVLRGTLTVVPDVSVATA